MTNFLNQQLQEVLSMEPSAIAFAVAMIAVCLMFARMDHEGIVALFSRGKKEESK